MNTTVEDGSRRACQRVPGKGNAAGGASAFRVAEGMVICVGEVSVIMVQR